MEMALSFRGHTIIANNLVAPVLWHRLSVLDPLAGLLARIQGIILDFFWDKLHWIPQDVLYLSKEEGGQGLVHLESRKGAFRIEFLKSLLYGPPDQTMEASCRIDFSSSWEFELW